MFKSHIESLLRGALEKCKINPPQIHVQSPENESFGDYTTNIAMQLAKQLKKNPMVIAEEIKETINKNNVIEKVEVVKPGFINFSLKTRLLIDNVSHLADPIESNKGKNVMFEFTDPNPFKEFHIGHLYDNFVGESLSRLYEETGANVRRAIYQGDVGMHVAKSIWGMKKKLRDEKLTIAELDNKILHEKVKYLGQCYALGATAYEEDTTAKEEIKNINYLVYISAQEYLSETKGLKPQVNYHQYLLKTKIDKSEVKELYAKGRTWSLEYFELIYKRIGARFDHYYFESFSAEYGSKVVKEFLKKGVFEESNGAIVYKGEKKGLHTRVFINSLGLPTYETKDIGLPIMKAQDFDYDLAVIVTANEIDDYFKVLKAAIFETNPNLGAKTKHISHGMVKLKTGKMSSRTGKVLTGEWLIDETKRHILEVIKQSDKTDSEYQDELADKLAIAAIKYAFLKVAVGRDVAFDFKESISLEGNSGPYLLYTYVRTQSLLKKAGSSTPSTVKNEYILEEDELTLLRGLYKYRDTVISAAENFSPNLVANYLYDIAQKYNNFYHKYNILKADEDKRTLRLKVTKSVGEVLNQGLSLLGIQTVEKM